MSLITIPDSFGAGGRNLAPAGAQGVPTLRDVLRELQNAVTNLSGKRTLTVGFADLNVAALTKSINLGAVLPAGARVTERELTFTPFSGGAVSALVLDIGGTDADGIVAAADIFTGATSPKAGTSGINPTGQLGGQQLVAKFTSTGANLSALTAGTITINLWYAIDP